MAKTQFPALSSHIHLPIMAQIHTALSRGKKEFRAPCTSYVDVPENLLHVLRLHKSVSI